MGRGLEFMVGCTDGTVLTCSPAFPDEEFLWSICNKNSRKHEGSFP